MEATYVLRPYEKKQPYKKKIDGGEITFYPCNGSVNGSFDVEAGYLLIVGDKEKLKYEQGYYKYVKVNLNGKLAFYKTKLSDDMAAKEIEDLRKSRIEITITPTYTNLKDDEVCKDFTAKGCYVEKKGISFNISASHMGKLEPFYYGDFYLAEAASFSGFKVKSPAMAVILSDMVNNKKGYHFVCDAYGDEKQGRSLVVLGISEGEDLMFLKRPEQNNYIWENAFEIFTDIEKYYSLSFLVTELPTDVTPLKILAALSKFYNEKELLSRETDAIIFSTR